MVNKKYLIGVFENENGILKAAEAVKRKKVPIMDAFTPYPVHGLDDAMGIKRSRLPYVTFFAGLTGFMCAMLFQVWITSIDWPIIVGGKPFNSVPAFVPITFEITVLLGGLTTVAAFFYIAKLRPGAQPQLMDALITDNHFILVLEQGESHEELENLKILMLTHGAKEVREKEVKEKESQQ